MLSMWGDTDLDRTTPDSGEIGVWDGGKEDWAGAPDDKLRSWLPGMIRSLSPPATITRQALGKVT